MAEREAELTVGARAGKHNNNVTALPSRFRTFKKSRFGFKLRSVQKKKKSPRPVCSRRGGEEEDEEEGGGGGGEAGWLTDSKYQMLFQRRRRTGSNKQERVMGSRFPDG